MTVLTSFTSKMGLRHITTTSSAATSVSICLNAGSNERTNRRSAVSVTTKIAWSKATRFFLVGICQRLCLSTACTTESAWAKKKNHRCHLRHRPWPATLSMCGNGLSAWRLSCHKRLTHTALTRYKKIGEFFFPSLGRTLKLFSVIQVYRFYEMCQGIMNNPVYYAEVICFMHATY